MKGWRRFHILAFLAAFLGVGAIAIMLSLPAIVHWQIKSVLAKAGYEEAQFTVDSANLYGVTISNLRAGKNAALQLSSAHIAYAPLRAVTGKIDAIRLAGAKIVLDLEATNSSEAQRHFDLWSDANASGLPIWRIELSDCALTLARGERRYTVHADGWLWREQMDSDRARISMTLHSDDGATPGWLEGHVHFALHQFDASAGISNVDLGRALPFVPAAVGEQIRSSGGLLSATASVVDAKGQITTQASFELRDGSVITTNDPAIEVEGASAKVSLASLNPLRSEEGQSIDVKKFKVGENVVENIHVEFDVDRRGLHPTTSESLPVAVPSNVRLTSLKFNWAQGQIESSSAIYVHPIDKSISMSLNIAHVGLDEFLRLVSSGKVSGKGSLSGNLSAKVTGSHIELRDGKIISDGPGEINFGQQLGELASSVSDKDPRLKCQQQQIMDALANFHYDRIVFEFVRGENGVQVMTQISGRGKKGLTTPIDLTVRYVGLEEALNAYLASSLRVNSVGER